MHLSHNQTTKHKNSDTCIVWEYEFPTSNLSIATAHINGRYPEAGMATNTTCEEMYYVLSGTGTLHTSKAESISLQTGDVYHFEIGESYAVEGNDLRIVLINSPKWSIDQYQIVSE